MVDDEGDQEGLDQDQALTDLERAISDRRASAGTVEQEQPEEREEP